MGCVWSSCDEYSSEDIKEEEIYMKWNIRGEVWAWDAHLKSWAGIWRWKQWTWMRLARKDSTQWDRKYEGNLTFKEYVEKHTHCRKVRIYKK